MIFRVLSRRFSTKKDVISVKDLYLKKPVGCVKTVQGWATSVRNMGKTVFIDVNDGSSTSPLQAVIPKENFNKHLQNGSSLKVTGILQTSEKGQLEMLVEELNIVGLCDVTDNYPFELKKVQPYDHYRKFIHFRPKLKYFNCMIRFRSAASQRVHNYFNENGFTLIHTPILTSGDCEGAAETFIVRPESQELIDSMKVLNTSSETTFFNSPAYLTVSGQLHLETVVRSFSKVYTFNTSFRAENSNSRLHLSEFYMVEAEEAFVTDLEVLLKRIEDFLKQVMLHMLSNHMDEIGYMLQHNKTNISEHLKILENTINQPFLVLTFSEAKQILNKYQDKIDSKLTPFNLTKAEEFFLVQHNNNVPVFVINWPKNEKPFYMKQTNENPNLVKGVDLLVPNVGELCGGSIREDDYDILKESLIKMEILDCMQWYLDLRKFGNVPSAGFGLGFERFLQFFLNIQNIKDAIPFPRWPHHLPL